MNGEVLEKPLNDIAGNDVPTMTIVYPSELQGKEGLVFLGKMFPALQSWSLKENISIQSENDQSGWLNVEATLDAPYCNTTEPQLKKYFDSQGRVGMNENVAILLSQFMKLTRGEFIDVKTVSRLLGSRDAGPILDIQFRSNGRLDVRSFLSSDVHNPYLGGRSVKVIQKQKMHR